MYKRLIELGWFNLEINTINILLGIEAIPSMLTDENDKLYIDHWVVVLGLLCFHIYIDPYYKRTKSNK